MKNTDLSYAAGLIDGEGSILLTQTQPNGNRYPCLSMTNTTHELLQFMKDLFGGSVTPIKKRQEHHKEAWHWKIVGNKALEAMSILLPYLREPEKVRRVKLLTENYKQLTPRNGKYTEEQLKAKKDFENRFLHPSVP